MSKFSSNSLNSVSPYYNSLNTICFAVFFYLFDPKDVLTAVLNLKPKHNSFNDISAFFLNTFAASFVSPPTIFCLNIFFSLHHFPKIGDLLLLSPIFKALGSVNNVPKYGSISCTSVSGKVLESLVKERLLTQIYAKWFDFERSD